jgi:hypothetical protein
MRTQIRFKSGQVETYDNSAPSIDTQSKELTLVGQDMDVIENIPLDKIEKVVFVP